MVMPLEVQGRRSCLGFSLGVFACVRGSRSPGGQESWEGRMEARRALAGSKQVLSEMLAVQRLLNIICFVLEG